MSETPDYKQCLINLLKGRSTVLLQTKVPTTATSGLVELSVDIPEIEEGSLGTDYDQQLDENENNTPDFAEIEKGGEPPDFGNAASSGIFSDHDGDDSFCIKYIRTQDGHIAFEDGQGTMIGIDIDECSHIKEVVMTVFSGCERKAIIDKTTVLYKGDNLDNEFIAEEERGGNPNIALAKGWVAEVFDGLLNVEQQPEIVPLQKPLNVSFHKLNSSLQAPIRETSTSSGYMSSSTSSAFTQRVTPSSSFVHRS